MNTTSEKVNRKSDTSSAALMAAAVEQLQVEVHRKLSKNPNTDVSEDLQRIGELEQALARQKQPWLPNLLWSFAVASLCVGTIALGMNWRVASIKLNFSVQTDAVEVRTASNWPHLKEGLVIHDHLSIRGATVFDADTDALENLQLSNPVRFDIISDSEKASPAHTLQLSVPVIQKNSLLRVACLSKEAMEITVTGPPIEAFALVTGSASVLGTDIPGKSPITVPDGEWIRIKNTLNRPITFSMRPEDATFTLAGEVRDIDFPADQPSSVDIPKFMSAIRGGKVTVRTVEATYSLDRFDKLQLSTVSGYAVIQKAGECMEVTFEGAAETAFLGKGSTSENIVPTQLAFWFQQQRMPFYLTVFGTLWGILWGAITWVRRNVKA